MDFGTLKKKSFIFHDNINPLLLETPNLAMARYDKPWLHLATRIAQWVKYGHEKTHWKTTSVLAFVCDNNRDWFVYCRMLAIGTIISCTVYLSTIIVSGVVLYGVSSNHVDICHLNLKVLFFLVSVVFYILQVYQVSTVSALPRMICSTFCMQVHFLPVMGILTI